MIYDRLLRGLARIQLKYGVLIILLLLVFTSFMFFGLLKVEFQGDMQEEMPQHLPIYQLNDRIGAMFGGQDTIFILLMLDDKLSIKDVPKDIREPQIMSYITELEESLSRESNIESIISVAPVIRDLPSGFSKEMVKESFSSFPETTGLVSEDFTKTIMIIRTDVGTGQEKVTALTSMIDDHLQALSTPAGVEVRVTGTPSIMNTIINLLKSDSINTLAIASLIILALLVVLQRSVPNALIIFIPIFLGITWTLGTLGWIGIKISVATAGLGAMILGLGVEYGVFMMTRYKEEYARTDDCNRALEETVPAVGSAIMGSGTTTIIGFLALNLSIMPMLQHLGTSLALGIFYSIIGAVVVEPLLIHYRSLIKWSQK